MSELFQRYICINSAGVRWSIAPADPKELKLSAFPGYALLSPYHYGAAYHESGFISSEGLATWEDDGHVEPYSHGLILRRVGECASMNVQHLFNTFPNLFRYLRYVSNQFDLRYEVAISGARSIDIISKGVFNSNFGHMQGGIEKALIYRTKITLGEFKKADKLLSKNFQIPVYEEILLDAIAEYNARRFSTAILYAAISAESMLRHRWEAEHLQMLRSRHKRLPWMERGERKDRMFDLLSNSDRFDTLLIDMPLYVRGLSLKEENEALYTRAKRLYSTRNGLVHRGDISRKKNSAFSLDSGGCTNAILTTLDLFNWMGIDKYDVFKLQGYVKL